MPLESGNAPTGVDVWLGNTQAGASGCGDHLAARGCGDQLAVRAAAAMLGVPGSRLGVIHEPAGRPRLTGDAEGIHLSVSHSRGVVAVAVTALGPVGVDLELVRSVTALAVARRWFGDSEVAWLAGQPAGQQGEAFLGLWTQKEAIAKALGTGLRGGAGLRQRVALSLPPSGPDRMVLAVVPGAPGLMASVARVSGDAILAVACLSRAAAGAPVTVRQAGQRPGS